VKRNYEVALVLVPNLSEQDTETLERKVGDWIEETGGTVLGSNHWGRRRLAYTIGSNREGYYLFIDAEMESKAVNEISRRLTIDNQVIRYLVVREDEE
jgi:small subunit ribosomal protein S6